MIDLHCHILYGLDDGPVTMDESIRMCRMSYRDGVSTIVATPHTLNGEYQNDRSTILTKVKELNEALRQCGLGNSDFGMNDPKPEKSHYFQSEICNLKSEMELKILPGSDVHFCTELLSRLDQGRVTTVGDSKRFLIIELPSHTMPPRGENLLFQLMARGIVPIISHPERNLWIMQRPERYYEMVRMGCLGQVTAMSLTGGFGPKIRQFAQKLLKKKLIHIIASDAHGINGRPPGLARALKEAEKIVGIEAAQKMVTEYPQAILEGKKPNVEEPLSP
jgi:protein-tyrosine phosphatase